MQFYAIVIVYSSRSSLLSFSPLLALSPGHAWLRRNPANGEGSSRGGSVSGGCSLGAPYLCRSLLHIYLSTYLALLALQSTRHHLCWRRVFVWLCERTGQTSRRAHVSVFGGYAREPVRQPEEGKLGEGLMYCRRLSDRTYVGSGDGKPARYIHNTYLRSGVEICSMVNGKYFSQQIYLIVPT